MLAVGCGKMWQAVGAAWRGPQCEGHRFATMAVLNTSNVWPLRLATPSGIMQLASGLVVDAPCSI